MTARGLLIRNYDEAFFICKLGYNQGMKEDEIVVEPQETTVEYDEEIVESNDDGTELSVADQTKKLREKIKTLEKEKQEYLDGWQRARADYANALKQSEDDRKKFKVFFQEQFIEDLFPVLDSFDMAMGNKALWESVDANWRKGIEYIHQQLLNTLAGHNFTPFCIVGDTFDPTMHEAVSDVETDDKALENTIAQVFQCGYRLGEKILRPARVSVYVTKK